MNLIQIYEKLLNHFGKQHWWPAETKFEIIIGAILTQQTTWKNVELAIRNLKRERLLDPHTLAMASINRVEALIRHTGFYRQKAERIVNFSQHLVSKYDGSLDKFFNRLTEKIREELLSLKGVGSETADSILLYAADKLIFPIDAYTMRLCERLGVKDTSHERLKDLFESYLPNDLEVYKEFHALIDKLGKTYCKAKPFCSKCPIANDCSFASTEVNNKVGIRIISLGKTRPAHIL